MGVSITQRNANRNQSTADFNVKRIFVFDNRFLPGVFKNKDNANFTIQDGMLLARDNGTYETGNVVFSATPLSAGQTIILAGLTYTSTGATTTAQLAAAFANLADGATTGGGTGTGTYSGALTGYTTGPVVTSNSVLFTSVVTGPVTDLAKTGTGASPVITIVQGSSAVADGYIKVTSSNLADIVAIAAVGGVVELEPDETLYINGGTKGTIDGNMLVLPASVTLSTIVGTKTLRDVIETIGLHVDTSSVEHTNFDN